MEARAKVHRARQTQKEETMNDDLPTLEFALEATILLLEQSGAKEAGATLGMHPEQLSGISAAAFHQRAENEPAFGLWLRRTWGELMPIIHHANTCEPWQREQADKEAVEKRESFFQVLIDMLTDQLYFCEECSNPTPQGILVCTCLLAKPGKAVAVLPVPSCSAGFIWCAERAKTGHTEDEQRCLCRACIDSKGLLAQATIIDAAKARSKRTKPRLR